MISGILNIKKEAGFTSHDVVERQQNFVTLSETGIRLMKRYFFLERKQILKIRVVRFLKRAR